MYFATKVVIIFFLNSNYHFYEQLWFYKLMVLDTRNVFIMYNVQFRQNPSRLTQGKPLLFSSTVSWSLWHGQDKPDIPSLSVSKRWKYLSKSKQGCRYDFLNFHIDSTNKIFIIPILSFISRMITKITGEYGMSMQFINTFATFYCWFIFSNYSLFRVWLAKRISSGFIWQPSLIYTLVVIDQYKNWFIFHHFKMCHYHSQQYPYCYPIGIILVIIIIIIIFIIDIVTIVLSLSSSLLISLYHCCFCYHLYCFLSLPFPLYHGYNNTLAVSLLSLWCHCDYNNCRVLFLWIWFKMPLPSSLLSPS